MLALSGQILDVMVVLMLAVVGALVLWLHFRLHQVRSSEKKMFMLSEKLNESLNKANRGLFEFSRVVRDEGPKVEAEVFKAGQTVQDLDFMLVKAEKLLKRMDDAFDRAGVVLEGVETHLKTEEKDTLLGTKRSTEKSSQKRVATVRPSRVAQPMKASSPELSEAEIEKKLERELLTGLINDLPEKSEQKRVVAEKSKRMASPQMGAMAYGGASQQVKRSTDAEKDLLKALEGRL